MRAVHFGAGNIGRGFIGEVLAENGFSITFVDVNETIINELNQRGSYEIEWADRLHERKTIQRSAGINNKTHPDEVIAALSVCDLVTTAIGPKILPFIAELIALGIEKRQKLGVEKSLDIIACENMIGGSQFLAAEVKKYLRGKAAVYAAEFIGFPNAAVDRIVPLQHHKAPLFVSVEPFREWVVDQSQMKNPQLQLASVRYVADLEPFIERKLFSVNTGHATVAYTGAYYGYSEIDQAIGDDRVLQELKAVLGETGTLLKKKWHFSSKEHETYRKKIIERFKNPYISDSIARVARTPIRKLGYDERFIRPIREAKELGQSYEALIQVTAMVLNYEDPNDSESVELQQKINTLGIVATVREVTGLTDSSLIEEIKNMYERLKIEK